jgi:hypothetical protein
MSSVFGRREQLAGVIRELSAKLAFTGLSWDQAFKAVCNSTKPLVDVTKLRIAKQELGNMAEQIYSSSSPNIPEDDEVEELDFNDLTYINDLENSHQTLRDLILILSSLCREDGDVGSMRVVGSEGNPITITKMAIRDNPVSEDDYVLVIK